MTAQSALRIGDPIEVSYAIHEVRQENLTETLQKLALLLNVQLNLDGKEIPFVSYTEFDKTKEIPKLFLFGSSGCGKSRALIEIIKSRMGHVKKIYVINPRGKPGDQLGRDNLATVVHNCDEDDLIVWDNFPNGIDRSDLDSLKKALDLVCLKSIKNLLLALNPRHLESLSSIVSNRNDIYYQEISYNKARIGEVMRAYGSHIIQFRHLYQDYVVKNEERITSALWQKDPLPLTILDYFKELKHKKESYESLDSEDAVFLAQDLKRPTDFYEYQFGLIENSKERRAEAEFMYTLKLCYELGVERTQETLSKLQKEIFGSHLEKYHIGFLGTWVYSQGDYYSMHDAPAGAITFSNKTRRQIMHYLSQNFFRVIPNQANSIYLAASFIGKNISFAKKTDVSEFLTDHAHDLRNSAYFEVGLGHGIGERYDKVRPSIQFMILARTRGNVMFTRALGESLGRNFLKFRKILQKQVLRKIRNSCIFSRGFGIGLGCIFAHIPTELQKQIFVESETNIQLADGLGIGLGNIMTYLSIDLQRWVVNWATKDGEFARGLGSGFGQSFTTMPEELQRLTYEMLENNVFFARGFGMGIGNAFIHLPKEIQKKILLESENNIQMSNGLGIGIGAEFFYLPSEYQKAFFNLVENDPEFAMGLGLGLAFIYNYLTNDQREEFELLSRNPSFDVGRGMGSGMAFRYFPTKRQSELFKLADRNENFARGFGNGLAYNWNYYANDFKRTILKKVESSQDFSMGAAYMLCRNFTSLTRHAQFLIMKMIDQKAHFAKGAGQGFGSRFTFLEKDLKEEIFRRAEKNRSLSAGLGSAIGCNYAFYSDSQIEEISVHARKNQDFAEGLGIGFGRCFKFLKSDKRNSLVKLTCDTPKIVIAARSDSPPSDM